MSDDSTEAAAPRDPAAGLAQALIILTTIMLLTATIAAYKAVGDRYHEGPLASK